MGTVLPGVSVAALSFLGFHLMTTPAEEIGEARKVVSKAVVMVISFIAFFFVSLTYFGAVIHPGAATPAPSMRDGMRTGGRGGDGD